MDTACASIEKRQVEKVIIFAGMGLGARIAPREVRQMDIIEERLLTSQAAQALHALERKRAEIRHALEAGATVEPGLHTAELARFERKPYAVAGSSGVRLIVR